MLHILKLECVYVQQGRSRQCSLHPENLLERGGESELGNFSRESVLYQTDEVLFMPFKTHSVAKDKRKVSPPMVVFFRASEPSCSWAVKRFGRVISTRPQVSGHRWGRTDSHSISPEFIGITAVDQ